MLSEMKIEIPIGKGRLTKPIQSAKLSNELEIIARNFLLLPNKRKELIKEDKDAAPIICHINKANSTKLKSDHFMGSKAFVAARAEINNITDLKALHTSGEASMTIDEIVDVVLSTKSGYIKGLGYGHKPNTTRATQKRTAELEDSLKKEKQEAVRAQHELQNCVAMDKGRSTSRVQRHELRINSRFQSQQSKLENMPPKRRNGNQSAPQLEDPLGDHILHVEFRTAFTTLAQFFPLELREDKVLEFINLRQDSMMVKEYFLRFTQLARYAPHVVVDGRAKMIKFVSGVNDSVIEEQMIRMRERQSKRARTDSFSFAQPKSKGGNRSQHSQKFSFLAPSSASAPVPKSKNNFHDGSPGSKT
ncbi:hypothetical protein FXO38_01308 [Capsicum annuum]|nr:hypothetical protein FXO38_01308 [Capsicum annuum]KAF3684657.1 hypothetical protein FXO37_01246 [Capsicum annuum]